MFILTFPKIVYTFLFSYVDANRSLAVNLSSNVDLKSLTSERRYQQRIIGEHGEVNEFMLIKLAGHYINKGLVRDALHYCEVALEINKNNTVRTV